jgi:hypothetical protein
LATYTKVKLSGSTDGKNIKVAATSTPGTTIHTAHATALDELFLYAANADTVARKLTIEWGGTTSPDDTIEITIQPESGPVLVIPGWLITNSLVVRGFAAAANVILINGFCNRIT